jgi:hypothetical protein
MLAQQARKDRGEEASTSPKHHVRLKKGKGPGAMYRENVVGSPRTHPPKVKQAWGSPEQPAPASKTGTSELDVAEALAEASAALAEAEQVAAEGRPEFAASDEDGDSTTVDDRSEVMQQTHEKSSADSIMDSLTSQFAKNNPRHVGSPRAASWDVDSELVDDNNVNDQANLPEGSKQTYERELVLQRGLGGKLGMQLAEWEQGGTGVIVDSVSVDGPSARCGVFANDVLVSIDNTPVLQSSMAQVAEIIHSCGDRFSVVVIQEMKILAIRSVEETRAVKESVVAEVAKEMAQLQAQVGVSVLYFSPLVECR